MRQPTIIWLLDRAALEHARALLQAYNHAKTHDYPGDAEAALDRLRSIPSYPHRMIEQVRRETGLYPRIELMPKSRLVSLGIKLGLRSQTIH